MIKNSKYGVMVPAMVIVLAATLVGCATLGGGSKNALVGSWELVSDWGVGDSEQILVVNDDLTGTFAEEKGDWTSELSDVSSEDGKVSFSYYYGGGNQYKISFEGTVSGDTLRGEFESGSKYASTVGTRN
jgi:hypothetical protein